MGKIFYLMGKSSSGKDTIYRELMKKKGDVLHAIVPYTTRPIRAGEQEGREYHFVDEAEFQRLMDGGKVIEQRAYQTFHGIWRYFTVDDGSMDLNATNYLMIGTLEAYESLCNYYSNDKIVPIYIEVEDGERLTRALNREKEQTEPKYEEKIGRASCRERV